MESLDYNIEDFNDSQQDEADRSLLVKFYLYSEKDVRESSSEGRPIFREREYIDIRVPGQRDSVIRPASARDKLRFPRHYSAFKQRLEMPVEGTPLTEWPAINRSLADELAFLNIKTVEQLSTLNDSSMHALKGGQIWKQKARDWLDSTKDDAILSKLRDELTERDDKITELTDNMNSLLSRLDALESKKEKKKKE